MKLDEERVYGNKYKVNYIFERNSESRWLIVTFSSGVSKIAEIKRPYHYINLCREFPFNRLYIQDSIGNRGTYYLCNNMDFQVSETVCNLILYICKTYNIPINNVITLGSCKGASSALHIGLKLNVGNILAIHPHLKIGSYVKEHALDVYKDMVGKGNDNNLTIIDKYLINLLKQDYSSNIKILVSELDDDYTFQFLPFENILLSHTNSDVLIEKNNLILSHDDTFYNLHFFRKHICQIVFKIDYFYKNGDFFIKNNGTPFYILIQRFNGEKDKRIICNQPLVINLNDVQKIFFINSKDSCAGIQIYNTYDTFIPTCKEKNDFLICENSFEKNDDKINCYLKIYCDNEPPFVVKNNESYTFFINKKEFPLPINRIKYCWEVDETKYEKIVYKS